MKEFPLRLLVELLTVETAKSGVVEAAETDEMIAEAEEVVAEIDLFGLINMVLQLVPTTVLSLKISLAV